MLSINFLAVIISAIAAFVIGFLAHGPVAGKLWMRLANITPTGNEKLKDMIPQMIWNLVVNIITAYVLAVICSYVSTSAVMIAFWVWLGFIATSTSIDVIWMGKSFKLWLFEAICSLVSVIAMGAIISAWN